MAGAAEASTLLVKGVTMNPSYAGPVLSPLQAAARMRSGIALRVVVFMVRLTKWDDVVWTPLPSRARQSYDVSGAKGGRRPSLRPQKQVLRARNVITLPCPARQR